MIEVTEHMMSIIIGKHMRRFKLEHHGRLPRDVYSRVCQMFKELGFNGTIANGFILGAWAGDADMQELLHKAYIHYRMTRPMPLVSR